MILKIDNIRINIDNISFIYEEEGMVVIDGQGIQLKHKKDIDIICRAFDWLHRTKFDQNLKKIGGK